jgi:hypothetical protein
VAPRVGLEAKARRRAFRLASNATPLTQLVSLLMTKVDIKLQQKLHLTSETAKGKVIQKLKDNVLMLVF